MSALQVVIFSTSLPHCESGGGKLMADTSLPTSGAGAITIAKTFVTQSELNGVVLDALGLSLAMIF